MKRHSVTELKTYDACRREHQFNYIDRLTLKEPPRGAPTLGSGIAVHYVVETICRDFPSTQPEKRDVELRAHDSLAEYYEGRDNAEQLVTKFLPGVLRAVAKIPSDVWETDWWVEHDISRQHEDFGGAPFEIVGRPDMFNINNGVITLADMKTTATDPLTYMLWEPQIRYYAWMLDSMFPGNVIQYRYVCVPTSEGKPPAQSPPWVFTPRALKATEREITSIVTEMSRRDRRPSYSRRCDWCNFNRICKMVVTGGDATSVIRDEYTTRPPRS